MIFKSFQSGQTYHMHWGQETGHNCFRVYPNTQAAKCQSLISGADPGETIPHYPTTRSRTRHTARQEFQEVVYLS